MSDFTYEKLVTRFGESLAGWCLTEIEKASRIKPQLADINHQGRLDAALRAQDIALPVSAVA